MAEHAGVDRARCAASPSGKTCSPRSLLPDAGQRAGTIRTVVDGRDVILLVGFLTRLHDSEWETRAHRLLTVGIDGLRRQD
ncbi:hypothetical protein [Gordonia rubripertincta]|uniref:SbtR family transcriptional regulator n=1 Tax=Gordonia rubripertincta TaxID=36822 RepID=UPI003464182F